MAKDFTQIEEIDFHETFEPVAKITTIHCLLVVVLARDRELYLIDVNNTFLHGDLDKEVYMRLPFGFDPLGSAIVYRLHNLLY